MLSENLRLTKKIRTINNKEFARFILLVKSALLFLIFKNINNVKLVLEICVNMCYTIKRKKSYLMEHYENLTI